MNETRYKRKLMSKYRSEGWLVVPTYGSIRGIPDYILLGKDGKVLFIEVKCNSDLSYVQRKRIEQLRLMGFKVKIHKYDDTW